MKKTDKQTDRQTDRQTDTRAGRHTDRQTDRQIDRQTDRQTGRQTDRQTDKQETETHTHTHTKIHLTTLFAHGNIPNILTLLLFAPDLLSEGLINDDVTSSTCSNTTILLHFIGSDQVVTSPHSHHQNFVNQNDRQVPLQMLSHRCLNIVQYPLLHTKYIKF